MDDRRTLIATDLPTDRVEHRGHQRDLDVVVVLVLPRAELDTEVA
ncbi:MAG: hypothetical protein WA731_18800 [Pseudonocardiaceae bacterium]|jgi:hypothetical protein|nr:hypothetical protein [Pseudonocardiaceae bacterium]